jgi:hypothetical protein
MDQSRQLSVPEFGVPSWKVNEPPVKTFTIIQVLFNSPESKHPGLVPLTLVLGLAAHRPAEHISLIAPKPFGSMAKDALEQTFAATTQSPATVGPPAGQVKENVILEAAVEVASNTK